MNKPRYTKYIKAIEPVIELIRTEIANSSKQIAVIDANMFKAEFGDSFKDNTVESAQWGFKYAFFIQGIVMNLKNNDKGKFYVFRNRIAGDKISAASIQKYVEKYEAANGKPAYLGDDKAPMPEPETTETPTDTPATEVTARSTGINIPVLLYLFHSLNHLSR